MTGMDIGAAREALGPLRRALRAEVSSVVADRLAEADRTAARLVAEARATADAILADARAAGVAAGAAVVAGRRAMLRRSVRGAELTARSAAYRELRQRVAAQVAARCARPEVRELLIGQVRAVLGADAIVTDAASGGVIGSFGGRRLDLDADTIAADALDELGAEVAELWAP